MSSPNYNKNYMQPGPRLPIDLRPDLTEEKCFTSLFQQEMERGGGGEVVNIWSTLMILSHVEQKSFPSSMPTLFFLLTVHCLNDTDFKRV